MYRETDHCIGSRAAGGFEALFAWKNKRMDIPLIQTHKISKRFQQDQPILQDLSLQMKAGSFTILMGRSGAGKSTLLHILAGLETSSSGKLIYEQKQMHARSEKEWARFRRLNIGMVFQEHNLIPYLSLLENTLLAGRLGKTSLKKISNRAEKLFEDLDILSLAHRLPAEVSGGERQRAAIARALINQPRILFADEPTGSLNESAGESVMQVFTELHEKGQSILLATHDLKAALHGTEIWFLRDGNTLNRWQNEMLSQREKEVEVHHWLQQQGW